MDRMVRVQYLVRLSGFFSSLPSSGYVVLYTVLSCGYWALSPRIEAVMRAAVALMVWHVSCACKIYPYHLKLCNFMTYICIFAMPVDKLWFLYQNCSFTFAFSPLESGGTR